jgi:hypothetical protein
LVDETVFNLKAPINQTVTINKVWPTSEAIYLQFLGNDIDPDYCEGEGVITFKYQ